MARSGTNHKGGRPKGSGVTNFIAKIVAAKTEEMIQEISKNSRAKQYVIKNSIQSNAYSGWIYIIKNKSNNLYKVGLTTQPKLSLRLKLYSLHFIDYELIYAGVHDLVDSVETHINQLIPSEQRVRGDWFESDSDFIIYLIKELTNILVNGRQEEQQGHAR